MEIPTKVTLEVTAEAYTTKVYAGDKKISDNDLQDFAEAVDTLDGFDIAGLLYGLQ